MGVIEDKLPKLGLTLPPPFQFPSPNRTGCVQVGTLLFVSVGMAELPHRIPVEINGEFELHT